MSEQVKIRIGADSSALGPDLKKAEGQFDKFGSSIKGRLAAAFTVGAVAAFANKVISTGGQIKDMAERLGTSSEFAQKIAYNFEDVGGNATDATLALEKLDTARRAALESPGGAEAGAFQNLGFTENDMLKDREGLYRTLGMQMDGQARTAEKMSAVTEIFGAKLAGKVVPAAESMAKAFERAEKSGLVMSDSSVSMMDAADKGRQRMEKRAVNLGAVGMTDYFQSASMLASSAFNAAIGGPSFKDGLSSMMDEYIAGMVSDLDRQRGVGPGDLNKKLERASLEALQEQGHWDWMTDQVKGQPEPVQAASRMVSAAQGIAGDSLTKVGNFLGESGRNIMAQLATQQIDILKKIESNTRGGSPGTSSLDVATP